MTIDNSLMNRKTRVRSSVTIADVADPLVSADFLNTKGCSYLELTINGLTGLEEVTIRPFFLETVNNSGTSETYVSRGASIALSKDNGETCNIPGVNGRPVFIKVDSLTGGANINIDAAPGRVPPGLNV